MTHKIINKYTKIKMVKDIEMKEIKIIKNTHMNILMMMRIVQNRNKVKMIMIRIKIMEKAILLNIMKVI